MKGILLKKPGPPDVLVIQDINKPVITYPTEVLVKLRAAGINPVDTKLRSGQYPVSALPAILGCDGAGIIETTGTDVKRFNPGDEVYFFHGGLGGLSGNYAEYIVLDERFLAKKPATIDFQQAAAAPLVLLTAWESLFDRANIKPGQQILIHAGAGGVGHVAIQLAKQAGARVCTTVSTEEKGEIARQQGAELVIFYKQQDVVETILEWTDGLGVDMALDTLGGQHIESTFPALKPYGVLVTLLQPDKEIDWQIARQRNLQINFEVMLAPLSMNLIEAQQHQTQILNHCAELIDNGKLQVKVSQSLPLAEAAAAHAMIEEGSTTGKIVLVMD